MQKLKKGKRLKSGKRFQSKVEKKEPSKKTKSKEVEKVYQLKKAADIETPVDDVLQLKFDQDAHSSQEDVFDPQNDQSKLSELNDKEDEIIGISDPLDKEEKKSLLSTSENDQTLSGSTDKLKPLTPQNSEKENLFTSLPDTVEQIVNQHFPLEDPKSINDLFNEDSFTALKLYWQNLKTLLQFECKLRGEKRKVRDHRFEDYMQKLDDAFQRAWKEAYHQVANLHDKF